MRYERTIGVNSLFKLFGGVLLVFLLFIGLLSSFYTVDAGERGILKTFGKPVMDAKEPGLHFKYPFGIQTVERMNVQTQKYQVPAEASSKDLQVVTSIIAVNYRIDASKAPTIYQELGVGYEDSILAPAVQERVKAATAQYTAEEVIEQRPLVKQMIQESLAEEMLTRNIIVEDVNIVNFDFSASFNEAIEQKVTAEQLKLKAERDLERIKIEAQQIEAQAIGQKNAVIAKAEGDAAAIALIDEQLRRSPTYIEYLATQKWNGYLPSVMGAGAVPFVDVTKYGATQ